MTKKTTSPAKKTATEFNIGDYVVYPTHGVGKIMGEDTQEVSGMTLRLFVISFEKDKMTLRVPVARAHTAGLRGISNMTQIEKAFRTLQGRAKTSRGMWSRRAQEYESKINSGSLISVAEVVRDLHKNVDQSERSYSERMIYESAFSRIVGELAAAEQTDITKATDKLLDVLKKQVAAA
ncbi:MAG: CarD family transcriptional regulator [Rickettsiales bacterium]|nr:CarD family transcriptional regulator [Rickettsiales bacterium]